MSLIDNVGDVGLASGLVTDKIVAVYEGSFSAGSGPYLFPAISYLPYTEIDHPFTRPVFVKLLWSSDGTNFYDGNSGGNAINSAIAYSTNDKIIVATSRSSGTLYYKVICFWIDDFDGSNPSVDPLVGNPSEIYLDSRLNYQKIYRQGNFTATPDGTITSIAHNLGYRPNVRVYVESLPGEVWPAHFGGTKNPWIYDLDMVEARVEVETDRVDISLWGSIFSPNSDAWYIIYYDE